jgi:hypothetical protein
MPGVNGFENSNLGSLVNSHCTIIANLDLLLEPAKAKFETSNMAQFVDCSANWANESGLDFKRLFGIFLNATSEWI